MRKIAAGTAYTGGKPVDQQSVQATASYNAQTVQLDGADCPLTAYLINGNNYVRLRDIRERIGFATIWDSAAKQSLSTLN